MKMRILWIAVLAPSFNLFFCAPAFPQEPAESDNSELPWTGGSGIQEATADLMLREEQLAAKEPAKVHRPRPRLARQPPQPGPDSPLPAPGLARGPLAGNPTSPTSPILPYSQTVADSFTAATLADASGFPPDPMGAVGPSQFLMVINGRVRTFNKTTGAADGVLNTT